MKKDLVATETTEKYYISSTNGDKKKVSEIFKKSKYLTNNYKILE